ncbi:alpha/beta hydrolase family protein [Streptomyces sp. NPDC090025]|uniref:alpha/beta hydrolase family protein n=1 Tax=Streptomyces sp. NPDC090025 TaxID=3365922 RepID=UPI003837473B
MRRTLPAAAALALTATITALLPTVSAHAQTGSPAAQPVQAAASAVTPGVPAAEGHELPAPTGRLPTGVTTLHLTDRDRPDPWVPEERRELMVSLWYPAVLPSAIRAPYMSEAESKVYVESILRDMNGGELPADPPLPMDLFHTVRTHSTVDALPLPTPRGLPLVILSPGFGMPRATLTGLAEELASRGYAVAAVGHNHEAHGTGLPDRTTDCVPCARPDFPKVGAVRAEDVSFVLDELTARGRTPGRGVRLDAGRVAMVGHSAGGFSTIPAMLRDARIKAAVDMDGNFHFPNDTPLDRPLLLLGRPSHVPGGPDTSWDRDWPEFTGWKRWLTVDATAHLSFTDMAPLGKSVGIPMQPMDGDRADRVVRAYVGAFLDTHLRGRPSALLDGPDPRFPEVRFHRSEGAS